MINIYRDFANQLLEHKTEMNEFLTLMREISRHAKDQRNRDLAKDIIKDLNDLKEEYECKIKFYRSIGRKHDAYLKTVSSEESQNSLLA